MDRRALPVEERRRSTVVTAVMMLAVAGVVAMAAACGSETAEPPDSRPTPESTDPASVTATAPEVATGPDAPPAATPAAATPSPPAAATPATGAAAPQPPVAPIAAPPAPARPAEPLSQGDPSGVREFPAESVWEALRQCQSQGDYTFVHPSGQYFGAYQFTVATWDRLATQRYTELLGILPSEAAPAEQDRMAYYLWIESGHARWPACSHVFTGDPPAEPVPVAAGDDGAGETPAPEDDGTAPGEGDAAQTPDAPAGTDGSGTASVEPGDESTGTTTTLPADLPELEIDPSVQPAIPPDVPGFPTEEQWEGLRQCESSGNYRAVSRNGLYYGAYQFWPDTWDFVAGRNYPRLVGVLPSHATPQDQTRMAYRLWEERGDQPWPVCGRHLRSTAGGG